MVRENSELGVIVKQALGKWGNDNSFGFFFHHHTRVSFFLSLPRSFENELRYTVQCNSSCVTFFFCGLRRSVFVVGAPSLRSLHDLRILDLTTLVIGLQMCVSGCMLQWGGRNRESPYLKSPLIIQVHHMSRSSL